MIWDWSGEWVNTSATHTRLYHHKDRYTELHKVLESWQPSTTLRLPASSRCEIMCRVTFSHHTNIDHTSEKLQMHQKEITFFRLSPQKKKTLVLSNIMHPQCRKFSQNVSRYVSLCTFKFYPEFNKIHWGEDDKSPLFPLQLAGVATKVHPAFLSHTWFGIPFPEQTSPFIRVCNQQLGMRWLVHPQGLGSTPGFSVLPKDTWTLPAGVMDWGQLSNCRLSDQCMATLPPGLRPPNSVNTSGFKKQIIWQR